MQTAQETELSHVRCMIYDANGNLTSDGNGKAYGWDAANRLISMTSGGNVTSWTYDGMGRRVQELQNGTITKQWVWGSWDTQPAEERDGSNNVTKRFYAQGEQINGTSYYFTKDHLGSVRELTNSSGALVARYDYDPYGRRAQILTGGTDLADFGFTGFYYDQQTGLDFTKFRVYAADLARWLSRDPFGEAGGINLYEYAANGPISFIDILGLCACYAIGVKMPDGSTYMPLTNAKPALAKLAGVPVGTPEPIFVPPNLDPAQYTNEGASYNGSFGALGRVAYKWRPNGPRDYKNCPPVGMYDAYGNLAYGNEEAAAGQSLDDVLSGPEGWKDIDQILHGGQPQGNDPQNVADIMTGYGIYKSGGTLTSIPVACP